MAVSTMGLTKAAIVLLSLDKEQAGEVVRRLPRDLVDDLMRTIGNLDAVDPALQQQVLEETLAVLDSWGQLVEGGWDAARRILEEAFSPQRAAELLRQLTASSRGTRPFHFLSRLDTGQLIQLLLPEHPQTVALVLAHAEAAQAADVLAAFPRERAAEVTRRLATMGKVPPAVIEALERVMESKLTMPAAPEPGGGVEAVVPVLNAADPKTEREILEVLAQTDAELAEAIRSQLFTFNDIVKLDDDTVQVILRRVETKTLALALRGASNEVQEKVFRNLSERAQAILNDEISVLGRVRMRDVEQAQRDITHLIHTLEEAGDIALPHGAEDETYI